MQRTRGADDDVEGNGVVCWVAGIVQRAQKRGELRGRHVERARDDYNNAQDSMVRSAVQCLVLVEVVVARCRTVLQCILSEGLVVALGDIARERCRCCRGQDRDGEKGQRCEQCDTSHFGQSMTANAGELAVEADTAARGCCGAHRLGRGAVFVRTLVENGE
jgi:hypothetical protein